MLLCIILVGVLPLCVTIILKNSLGKLFVEKLLNEIFETRVEITNMTVGVMTPTISIAQLTVDDADDDSLFFLKTGLITIQYNWKEYFKNRTFYISEITVDNVEVYTQKSGSNRSVYADTSAMQKGKLLDNIVETIDIDKTANQLTVFKKLDALHTNINQLKKYSSNTMDEISKILTDIQNRYPTILSSVQNATDIPTLQYALNDVQNLMLYIEVLNRNIQRIENDVTSFTNQITTFSQSENIRLLEQDIYGMMNAYYHNPSEIALNICQEILNDIVVERINLHQKFGHRVIVGLRNLGKKMISSTREKKFYIGKMKIALALNKHNWMFIETQDITHQIYSSTQPIDFAMSASENTDDIEIQGKGNITPFLKAEGSSSLNITYRNMPFMLSHPSLNLIQIQEIQGALDGALNFVLREYAQDRVQINNSANIHKVLAVGKSEFGDHIALGVEESSPIDILVDMEIEKDTPLYADVQSDALEDISISLAPLLQSEITVQATALSEQMQKKINNNMKIILDKIRKEIDSIMGIVEEQEKRIAKIKVDIKHLQDISQEKNIQLVKSYAKGQIKKDIERIRSAVPFKKE